ncbi:hypothetical protein QWY77_05680 [Thalassotalea ponticola]|uniref:hypothetical protein n=1 Tax=Thalassotalea ponticola TaxID=1523392 RepID=UPI0025B34EB1|nr:hypothetical protein [Thalassotalea ponticola]MDN3652248.1 hypothetical protein [Thalassotalea ponticola]
MKKLYSLCLIVALVGCDGDSKPEILAHNYADEAAKKCITSLYEEGEVENFEDITSFYCIGNILSTEDFAMLTNLKELALSPESDSPYEFYFDGSFMPQVEYLSILSHDLKSLNLSSNESLKELRLHGVTGLVELITDNNSSLKNLKIYQSSISKVDLSQNVNLSTFEAEYHNLDNINLNNHAELETVTVSHGNLETLTIDAPKLKRLKLDSNNIETIDTSLSPLLEYLVLASNKINTVNVDANQNLRTLSLEDNPLSDETISYLNSIEWIGNLTY